jgi:hypothetical protein
LWDAESSCSRAKDEADKGDAGTEILKQKNQIFIAKFTGADITLLKESEALHLVQHEESLAR